MYIRDFGAVQKTLSFSSRFKPDNSLLLVFKQYSTLRDICMTLVIQQKRASSSKQLFHSHYNQVLNILSLVPC